MKDLSPVTSKPPAEPFIYDQNEKLKQLLDQQNKNARIGGGRSDIWKDRYPRENDRPLLGRGRGNRSNEHFEQGRDRIRDKDFRRMGEVYRSTKEENQQKEDFHQKEEYSRNEVDYRQNDGCDANGYRPNGNMRKEDGYRGREDGYKGREDGYRGREDGYRGREDGYRGREDEYRGREDGYRGREDGYVDKEDRYIGKEDKYRDRKEDHRVRLGESREDGREMPRKFERGDLRNSLRERRAAREITLAKPTTSSFKYPRYSVIR